MFLPCCDGSGRRPPCWWGPGACRSPERRPWRGGGPCPPEPHTVCRLCRTDSLLGRANTSRTLPRIHQGTFPGLIITTGERQGIILWRICLWVCILYSVETEGFIQKQLKSNQHYTMKLLNLDWWPIDNWLTGILYQEGMLFINPELFCSY